MNRDNQQGTRDFMLGWVIGAIEGEGTIGIHRAGSNKFYYKPIVKIYNTEIRFIDRCHSYLMLLDIPHYIYKAIPRIKFLNKKYRPLYSINILGFKRCKKALDILINYFVVKKEKAYLLHELCIERLKTPMTFQNQGRQYTDKERKLIEELKILNLRGKDSGLLNDYTQNARNGDDIV